MEEVLGDGRRSRRSEEKAPRRRCPPGGPFSLKPRKPHADEKKKREKRRSESFTCLHNLGSFPW
jgi:hypothetical protein